MLNPSPLPLPLSPKEFGRKYSTPKSIDGNTFTQLGLLTEKTGSSCQFPSLA